MHQETNDQRWRIQKYDKLLDYSGPQLNILGGSTP